jgi:hypothetical protein
MYLDRLAKYFIIPYLEYMILYNAVLWCYTFGQFHRNVTLVTKFLIYIFENNKSYVQNEAHFRRVRWELNYCTKRCNILTRFLVDFYVTNIRLLWKCPSRLRHYFLGPFDDFITEFYWDSCLETFQTTLGSGVYFTISIQYCKRDQETGLWRMLREHKDKENVICRCSDSRDRQATIHCIVTQMTVHAVVRRSRKARSLADCMFLRRSGELDSRSRETLSVINMLGLR